MEHTCGGMFDLSCEACYEERLQLESQREDYPGESRYCGEFEVYGWDVVGGL